MRTFILPSLPYVVIFPFMICTGQPSIWGELSEEVTLPCSFTPGDNVVIHWYVGSKNVHRYFNGADQLEKQDVGYKGRTSLFLSELSRGNASLKIINVQRSDEEKYSCYVGTKEGREQEESTVKLHVAVFKEQSIHYEAKNKEIHLSCYVNNSFPANATNIRWYQNGNLHKESMASRSSLNITNHTDIIQCVIEHTSLNTNWTGYWQMTEHNLTEGQSAEFECELCQTKNTSVSVTWSLRNNSQETEIASLDNATDKLKFSEKYKPRITLIDVNHFKINDLTEEDEGDYVCVITEAKGMHINVTSISINSAERSYLTIIVFVISGIIIIIIILTIFFIRRSQNRRYMSAAEDHAEDTQRTNDLLL
ncbi:HERV-H LTR-associating protein 2 [Spea bombifrons]|uniref:HERV-H LTR-associating protein 2 n=1 Tax=Spea bombifrons TaxID=233779 RepID=UPI002349399C|nr:HERV-H LTR-associating protein 2 [Spea bombifrons]